MQQLFINGAAHVAQRLGINLDAGELHIGQNLQQRHLQIVIELHHGRLFQCRMQLGGQPIGNVGIFGGVSTCPVEWNVGKADLRGPATNKF